MIAADAPARRSIAAGQGVLSALALLTLCGLGGFSSLLVWASFDHGQPAQSLVGATIGLACFAGLAALAQRQRHLSQPRWVVLLVSCGLGALSTFFLSVPHAPAAVVIGLAQLLVGFAGIWAAVFLPSRHPLSSAQRLDETRHRVYHHTITLFRARRSTCRVFGSEYSCTRSRRAMPRLPRP